MSGGGVEVVVALLDVLPVISFVPAKAEKAFLENGVLTIPEGGGKTEASFAIRPAIETVFAPTIDARAGVIVWELRPTVPMGRVVLSHRAPLPLAQIRPPTEPVAGPLAVFDQSLFLAGHGRADSVRWEANGEARND